MRLAASAAFKDDRGGGHQSLIPGFPDHLVVQQIFSRISWWDYESALKVSRGWRSAIQQQNRIRPTSQFSTLLGCLHPAKKPKRNHQEQQPPTSPFFAISVCNPRNPNPSWETLPPIPGISCGAPLSGRCICIENQLFVIGGRDPESWEFIAEVFSLNLEQRNPERSWRRCAPMSTARSAFACAASNGKIFVAGGQGDEVITLASAEVYDSARDVWESLPDLNIPRTECNGAVIGDRICVLGGYSSYDSSAISSVCDDDDDSLATFWVSSADTIRVGSKSWVTIDKVESPCIAAADEAWQIRSGILQSVHRSVLRTLLQKSSSDSWRIVEGKIVCSSISYEAGDEEEQLMLLAGARGRDEVYACACCLDSSTVPGSNSSGKVKVSLHRAVVDSGGKLLNWERIHCPFELSRYGASCFLV